MYTIAFLHPLTKKLHNFFAPLYTNSSFYTHVVVCTTSTKFYIAAYPWISFTTSTSHLHYLILFSVLMISYPFMFHVGYLIVFMFLVSASRSPLLNIYWYWFSWPFFQGHFHSHEKPHHCRGNVSLFNTRGGSFICMAGTYCEWNFQHWVWVISACQCNVLSFCIKLCSFYPATKKASCLFKQQPGDQWF